MQALPSKLVPVRPPVTYVPRGERWLADVMERRLTSVIAGAGFGKSTLLASWAASVPSASYAAEPGERSAATLAKALSRAFALDLDLGAAGAEADPDSLASTLVEAVETAFAEDVLVLLDDVHELRPGSPSVGFVRSLVRQAAPRVHVVLASRVELPFSVERLRGRGEVLSLGATQLRFSITEVSVLAEQILGEKGAALAHPLHELTDGWPAAVRLALESLRGVSPEDQRRLLGRVGRPGGPLYAYLIEEVIKRERPAVRRLLELTAPLDRFTAELCVDLGVPHAAQLLEELTRGGLFIELVGSGGGWVRLHALVRETVSAAIDSEVSQKRCREAGRWFESHGLFEDALLLAVKASDAGVAARLLAEHGQQLISVGAFDAIAAAAELFPDDLHDPGVQVFVADAHHCAGDDDAARVWLTRATRDAGQVNTSLRLRLGFLYADRPREMLSVLKPDHLDQATDVDEVQLLATSASAALDVGDIESARRYARRAYDGAGHVGLRQQGEMALGLVLEADGDLEAAAAHYEAARRRAEETGDHNSSCQAALSLARLHGDQGRYESALSEIEDASRHARLALFRAWSDYICAHIDVERGRFEEALRKLDELQSSAERLGYRYPYVMQAIGDANRERGVLSRARGAYEDARASANRSGFRDDVGLALAGLARLTAADDPREARRLAREAVELASMGGRPIALVAHGWVALAAGNASEASADAEAALREARRRGFRARVAEALELQALAHGSPAPLIEASALWRDLGNRVGEARDALALAHLDGTPAGVELARRRLRSLGVLSTAADAAGIYAQLPRADDAPVVIQTLGRFVVVRAGTAVGAAAWRSRKARAALKILIARRGRKTPRDFLIETLWPGEEPDLAARRLSVALSTIRAVLDPDHRFPAEHFLAGDHEAVALNVANFVIDVESFFAEAEAGLALLRQGQDDDGLELLEAAEAAYTGDFLEEDAYEDWAIPLREEARATYLAVARALAVEADLEESVRLRLRILERDPYDEDAHLGLVVTLAEAGRHGEARRSYRRYQKRMDEIGVEPVPFPNVTRASTTRS
jgi:ATP/maltotriose-dependent transcriptional regulator MalT/DNA-binding SARP family transcriptional activator